VALVYSKHTAERVSPWDDGLYVANNPQVTAPLGACAVLRPNKISNVFSDRSPSQTLAWNQAMNGGKPYAFSPVSISCLHAAVTWLLYLLLLAILEDVARMRQEPWAFRGRVCCFAVHPIHTEGCRLRCGGRAEMLAAGFLLAAWILHLRDHEIAALILLSAGAAVEGICRGPSWR